jgi:predicted ATPase
VTTQLVILNGGSSSGKSGNIAALARAGARIVVDDVFLGGAASQERWR